MTTQERLTLNDFSRVWFIQNRAGPGNAPTYEGFWKADKVVAAFGDITPVYVPDPSQYGQFDLAGKIIGRRPLPTLGITARNKADEESLLLKIGRLACDHDIQVRQGLCEDPQDPRRGWEKIVVLEGARPTQYETDPLGALGPEERNVVNEIVPFTGEEVYEVLRINFAEQGAAVVVQKVIAISVCDRTTCGQCGIASDGCQLVLAVVLSQGGSPGLGTQALYTTDAGSNWAARPVTSIAANENASGFACVAGKMVIVSNGELDLHYATIADLVNAVETWVKVTTGFVAAKGPNAIWSADSAHTWIVGDGGYIYTTTDPTAGVSVQDAGSATTQNLKAIHGLDSQNLVAVGANNAVVYTSNGGATWASILGPNPGVTLNTVWMRSPTEWFIGDASGNLWYTRNTGATWTAKTFPGSGAGQVRDIRFASPTVGYMAHDTATPTGRILRTVDGGFAWYVAPEGTGFIPNNQQIAALATCDKEVNVVWGGGLASNGTDGIIVKGA